MKSINSSEILKKTIEEIKKVMPDDIIGRYDDIGNEVDIQTISTGSLAVDNALGGGLAKFRLINFIGHTSSGKTTLALTAAAMLQNEKPDAGILYVDAEQALDPSYAEALGVNMSKIFLMQPSSGENGFTAAEMFINSGVADLVIIDSIAAMLPKSMIERDLADDAQPGQFAKLISRAIGRINRLANQKRCTVILINQWKPVVKINQYAAVSGAMGNWYQPGGAQLPFFCSQMIEVKKSGEIKEGKEIKSSVITMTCKKNKIAPPYRTADFVITYGKGLDKTQELVSLGVSLGVIKIGGAFYSIPEINEKATFRGRNSLSKALEEDSELCAKLEAILKEKISGKRDIRILESQSSEDGDEDMQYEEVDTENIDSDM